MTAEEYTDSSMGIHSYMMTPDVTATMYDGTSSDSSASPPMTPSGFDGFSTTNGFLAYQPFPLSYPIASDGMVPAGLIPVELDIEGLYEDHDRRRKRNPDGKPVPSHVHSRRRAQNRASQRAFRDRKEKHMRELEERLSELEGRHNELTKSYDSLQGEYTTVKMELDSLRSESSKFEDSTRRYMFKGVEGAKSESLDPLLFDVSAFCIDQEDDKNQ